MYLNKDNNSIKKQILEIHENPDLKKVNFGCGKDIRPIEKGWINLDTVAQSNVLKLDLFDIPWNFDSDSFDYILCRSILEHVPHNIEKYGYEINFMQLLIEEMWRIMKVGAILDIEVPNDLSSIVEAIDHKRIVCPHTFHIFYPNSVWNYYTSARFELYGVNLNGDEPFRFRLAKLLARKLFCIDIRFLRPYTSHFCLRKLPVSR